MNQLRCFPVFYNSEFESTMNITSESLVVQVNQYITEIVSISMHLEKKDTKLPHLKLLQQKVKIKLTHFQTALDQLKYSQHSGTTLKQIAQHLSNSFSQIVKEAHRLLQIQTGEDGEKRLNNKLTVLRDIENEMNEDWEDGFKERKGGLLKRIDQNTTMLADHVDQTKLKEIAKECLQKEFLAIRMVAYKMYEQYTEHSHSNLLQQIQDLHREHKQMSSQAEQLAQLNKQLKMEEKRLTRQMNELKTTNELISQRYFVQGCSGTKQE